MPLVLLENGRCTSFTKQYDIMSLLYEDSGGDIVCVRSRIFPPLFSCEKLPSLKASQRVNANKICVQCCIGPRDCKGGIDTEGN